MGRWHGWHRRVEGRWYYLVASMTGAGAAGAISWNCGSGRSFGGFESLVQQQDEATSATVAAANAVRMRIMGMFG